MMFCALPHESVIAYASFRRSPIAQHAGSWPAESHHKDQRTTPKKFDDGTLRRMKGAISATLAVAAFGTAEIERRRSLRQSKSAFEPVLPVEARIFHDDLP
jgi:hypothetical protein